MAMNWVKEQNIFQHLLKFPRLNKVRIVKQMKGRPFTAEEFERMLQAVEKTLKPRQHASVKFLLNGLSVVRAATRQKVTLQVTLNKKGVPDESGTPFFSM